MIKAIFLDRDGVINSKPNHPEIKDNKGKICRDALSLDEYKKNIYPSTKRLINKLKNAGYEIIIISNQGAIAKGFYTQEILNNINNYIKKSLGITHQYYCLHHPDYTGECNCRKPKPDLILNAAKELNINLKESYVIGDSDSDVIAGKNAGCKTIKIESGRLKDAVKTIMEEN